MILNIFESKIENKYQLSESLWKEDSTSTVFLISSLCFAAFYLLAMYSCRILILLMLKIYKFNSMFCSLESLIRCTNCVSYSLGKYFNFIANSFLWARSDELVSLYFLWKVVFLVDDFLIMDISGFIGVIGSDFSFSKYFSNSDVIAQKSKLFLLKA